MPELPEVEVTKLGIAEVLVNSVIKSFVIRTNNLREPISNDFYTLKDLLVSTVERRAKYIIIRTNKGAILIHLGMSGHLSIIRDNTSINKHDHIDMILNSNVIIRFNDQRRFGLFLWYPLGENVYNSKWLINLGYEPFDELLTPLVMYQLFLKHKKCIKSVLLENKVVVGVGNIYASEVLFLSKISPLLDSNKITLQQCDTLLSNIRKVLRCAINNGGTTIRDFSDTNGNHGHYVDQLLVYGKNQQQCPRCACILQKTVICGRATYFCLNCQK